MPKERSHWLLARRLADRLEAGPLADAVLAYPEHLLLGAVSHDTGYYALGDRGAQTASDLVHGAHGADPWSPFRALALHRETWGAAGLAFGLGALTHLAADVTFHPLVFSWTGDPAADDPALAAGWLYRHQACETALDLHLEALWGPAPARTYAGLLRRAGPGVGALVSLFLGDEARAWVQAHARLQGLFHHGAAALVARLVAWGNPGGDGDQSAAFYRGGPGRHPAFEGSLAWVDPVTGRPEAASLDELVARYDELVMGLAGEWQAAWVGGGVPFAGRVGPALDTGVPVDQPQRKAFFSPKWF